MATVKKDIEEVSDKINKVKKLVRKRVASLKYKDIPETPVSEGVHWKDLSFLYPERVIRLGTLFSGIGAIEHAFQRLGLRHKIMFAGDIEPNCKKSYFANYEIKSEIYKKLNFLAITSFEKDPCTSVASYSLMWKLSFQAK